MKSFVRLEVVHAVQELTDNDTQGYKSSSS